MRAALFAFLLWPLTGAWCAQGTFLDAEFARARGLRKYEVRNLDYMRIACGRRIFSPEGWQVQGDADLKVTNVGPDYLAAELPSHFSFVAFGGFNPYRNSVADVDTISSLVLLSVRGWKDGSPLRLKKYVSLSSTREDAPPQTVLAVDELRVMEGNYPTAFLVRETIHTNPALILYFICQ